MNNKVYNHMPLCTKLYRVFVHIQMLKMRTCAYVHHPCTLAHTPNCTQECIKSVIYIDKRTHACKSKRKEKKNYKSDKRCSLF